ncbi:MAG: hypothetical protein GXO35_04050 [Gammaproteobacteria bacterium]|nr:hypothetical protein [Gammaproteobacteria bacterium]
MLRVSYILYLVVLIFAPVAFGTIDIWAEAVVETMSALSFFFYLVAVSRKQVRFRHVPGLLPFLVFLCWHLMQVIPLPVSLVNLLSPATVRIYSDALPMGLPGKVTISLHPYLTLKEFFRFASYLLIYVLTVQLLSNRLRLRRTVDIVIALATFISIEAIIQALSGSHAMYGIRTSFKPDLVFGPFVYKNHFAGFAEMLLPLSLTLFMYYRPKMSYSRNWRRNITGFFKNQVTNRYILYGFAASMLVLALLFSRSRGGIICSFISLVILGVLGRKRLRINLRILIPISILTIVLLGVVKVGLQRTDVRFGETLVRSDFSINGRVQFWKNSLEIVKDFPLTGSGFGTFSDIYPSYNPEASGFFLRNCHNDYLENLTDGGIVAACIIAWFFVLLIRDTWPVFRRRRDRYAVHIFLGSLAGVTALLLHSTFEFQFNTTAAIGLYFFFLLGMLVASAHIRFHGSQQTLLAAVNMSPVLRPVVMCFVISFFFASLFFQSGSLKAAHLSNVWPPIVSPLATNEELGRIEEKTQRYIHLSPLQFKGHFLRAIVLQHLARENEAQRELNTALCLAPANYTLLQLAGFVMPDQSLAGKLFEASIKRGKGVPSLYITFGNWLMLRKKPVEARHQFTSALSLDPSQTKSLIALFTAKSYPLDLLERALPERVRPYLDFGTHWDKLKEKNKAAKAYLQAVQYVDREQKVQKSFFLRPFYFFYRNHDDAQALAILKQGISLLPEESALYLALGDLYRRQGMTRLAEQAYRTSLNLASSGKSQDKARQRLARLSRQ